MSFLKRLFGGDKPKPAPAADQVPADPLAQDRHSASLYDRAGDPEAWANAHQILASNMISVAAGQPPAEALPLYAEAIATLGEALDAAGPGANAAFRASMLKLRGEAAWRSAQMQEGDARARGLASCANWMGEAASLCPPETNRTLWVDAQLFRGAAFNDLALLKSGSEKLERFDDAANCFAAVATKGTDSGVLHPIAAFNGYVVLELRANATPPRDARRYYEAARAALTDALSDPTFAANIPDAETRLATLNSAIAKHS